MLFLPLAFKPDLDRGLPFRAAAVGGMYVKRDRAA